jgi:hypothetical protein
MQVKGGTFMNFCHRCSLILGIIISFFLFYLTPFAAMAADDSHTMFQGLKSVYVQVNPINTKTQGKGIVASQLREETEQQLKNAGIQVLSDEEFNRFKISLKYPLARIVLSVSIEEIPTESTTLDVSNITVEVQQAAFLGRKATISMFATTWERNQIIFGGSGQVQGKIRAFIAEFITAYTGANP